MLGDTAATGGPSGIGDPAGGEAAASRGGTATPRRVVVLGASNVCRGLARFTAVLESREPEPLDLFLAVGHGRSYGATSRVWLRRLPSIIRCGLWRALDREPSSDPRPVALVTDIGNDLLYGFAPAQVAEWVEACLAGLRERGLRIAITGLPLASVARVGAIRYRALCTLYVPGCPLTLPGLRAAAEELDARVAALAARHGAAHIAQPAEWYGLDAIHVRRRRLDDLWQRVADAWGLPATASATPSSPRRSGSFARWAAVGSRAAEVRSLAGRPRFTPQPVLVRDRLRLWMY